MAIKDFFRLQPKKYMAIFYFHKQHMNCVIYSLKFTVSDIYYYTIFSITVFIQGFQINRITFYFLSIILKDEQGGSVEVPNHQRAQNTHFYNTFINTFYRLVPVSRWHVPEYYYSIRKFIILLLRYILNCFFLLCFCLFVFISLLYFA